MKDAVYIALAANSNYLMPCTVLLQSVFEHNANLSIVVCLLHIEGSISEKDLAELEKWIAEKGSRLKRLPVRPEQLSSFPETRHGKAALLRLCLPELLPEVDKILYLDGDIVVKGSLAELFAVDLGRNRIAAVRDTCPVYHPERMQLLHIAPEHWYFNSGVVLMSLAAFRKIDLAGTVRRYANEHFDVIESPDQDTLNFICQGSTLYLHPRYNMNYSVERDVAAQTWGRNEVAEAKKNPVVLHYIGAVKPWSSVYCTHPRRKDWWRCLAKTPYAGYVPKDDSPKDRLKARILIAAKRVEYWFTLSGKRRMGRAFPEKLKGGLKRFLQKK